VIGNVIALFFLGRLSDQVGRRIISLPAIGVAAVSTIFYLLASGTGWLYWARVLSGLSIGLGSGTCTAWLVELSEDKDESAASVLATAANMLGLGVGPLLGGFLAQYGAWPLHLCFVISMTRLELIKNKFSWIYIKSITMESYHVVISS